MNIKELCEMIDERKQELFDLLSDLIHINSENFGASGNEKPCAEYIDNLCRELGLESDVYSPLDVEGLAESEDYFPGRNLENRPNVTARWRGKTDVDALMLMGHTDTVEIGDPANWERDPLSGEQSDGKIFGRGACDDKYALAATLFLIRLLKDAGFTPKENILFTAYSDEELGGSHGALASAMRYPCRTILNMDGRQQQVWHCASGGQVMDFRFHTADTVASAAKAARALPVVMDALEPFAERRYTELENNRFYKGTTIPPTSMRYMEVRAGQNGLDMDSGLVRFTYYTDKTREEIYAEFDELNKTLTALLAEQGIVSDGFVPYTRFFHYGYCEADAEPIRELIAAAEEVGGDVPRVYASCLSDLSILLKYSDGNAIAFGAGREFSDEGGAHQPNEFIYCDKLVEYVKIIGAYIIRTEG